jgi:hypothetical protein
MAAITMMAVGAGAQMVDSLVRQSKAKKMLKQMEGKMPQYRTVEDIQRQAKAMTPGGFEPEQMAQARQDIARQAAGGYRMATQSNPNLAGAVQAGINYGTISNLTDLAAKDAAMRRQRIESTAQMLTGADVRKTGEERQMFLEKSRTLGDAISQAQQQRADAFQSLIYGGAQLAGGGAGGGGGTQAGRLASPSQAPMASAGAPSGTFYGTDASGMEVSINPQLRSQYDRGFRPGISDENSQVGMNLYSLGKY